MPRDLFASQDTQQQPITQQGPRDLFAEAPAQEQTPPLSNKGMDVALGLNNDDSALAAVGGASNAGANMFEAGVDAVTWLGEKLGAIDPKIADQMKKDVAADMDKYFRSSDKTLETNPNDVVNKAVMNNPAIAGITQGALEVGLLSKAVPPMIKGTGAGNLAANLGVQSGAGALMSAGLAGGSTENQDTAAMIGAAIPPAITAAGAGIKAGASALASKFSWADDLKNVVAPINKELAMNNQMNTTDKAAASIHNFVSKAKEVADSHYDVIKKLPGTITPTSINVKLNTILSNKNLPPEQAAIFHRIQEDLNTRVVSMTDALKFKQSLGDYFSTMRGSAAYQDYVDVRKLVQKQIESRAKSAGLGEALTFADKYHKKIIQPLQNDGSFELATAFQNRVDDPSAYAKAINGLITKAKQTPQKLDALLKRMDDTGSKIVEQDMIKSSLDDLINAPEAFDKNKALRLINKNISKFEGVMSTDSIKSLQGVKKVLEKAGATQATQTMGSRIQAQITTRTAGLAVGSAVGSVLGPVSTAIGGIAGAGIAPVAIKFTAKLLESPQGMAMLRSIGSGKPWTKNLGNILKAAGIYGATEDNK